MSTKQPADQGEARGGTSSPLDGEGVREPHPLDEIDPARVIAAAIYRSIGHAPHEPDEFRDLSKVDQLEYVRLGGECVQALRASGHFTDQLEAEPDTRIDDLLERVDQLLALARGDHGVVQ